MKRYSLVLAGFLISAFFTAFAEDHLTMHVSPGIAFGRVHTDPDTAGFASNGIALRGKVTIMYDWSIKDTYYLSGGLAFSTQQIGLKNANIQVRHEIQYLQLPVLLKLYTGELDLDLRGYATMGCVGAFKINNHVTHLTGKETFVPKLRMWDVGLLLGCGVEYNLSLFTSVFAGISYQLGLSSILVDQRDNNMPKLYGYGDFITFDIGVRF